MRPTRAPAPVPLTSLSTVVMARVAPWAFTLLAGATAVGAWLGLLGPEASEPIVRWGILGVAAFGSAAQHWWFGRFRHVWLDGDMLIVGDPRRGVRVRLQDVEEVEETRMQKLKWVRVRLSRQTPIGDTLRFIPRGREGWLLPWLSSPVAAELRDRVQALRSGAPPHKELRRGS